MPESPPAAPPPTQAPTIVDSGPPPPPPAPTSEIHVTESSVETVPSSQPRKGSAMERMQSELRKRAKPQFFEEAQPPQAAEQPQTPPADSPTPESADPGPGEGVGESANTAPAPSAQEKGKGEKNPWKLVDRYKSEANQHKTRVAELEKAMPELPKFEAMQKHFQEVAKRNEELEKEIRFVNYQKSTEYQEQYEAPYNAAWGRFAKEISQIPATDRSGETRPGSVEDIAEICNMPLGEAQATCEERFGSLASYVMNYRTKIMELHEQRTMALEKQKNASIERDKNYFTQQQQQDAERGKYIKETWSKANEELVKDETHGPLFREVEGDQDGNQRLAKGFELVDRAFSENPNDPRLSTEERAAVVKRHAAVRMRAAAFGRLNARFLKLQAEHDALKKKLNGYQQSTPATGSANGSASPPGQQSSWDRIRGDLQKIAK